MKFKFSAVLIPALLLAGIVSLRVAGQNRFEEISLKVFDTFQKIHPRPFEDAGVRFIDIDDETLKRYGQWPWPRTQAAELINKLSESGAAAVTLDIVFSEPDRTSPSNVIKSWEKTSSPELAQFVKGLPDHDRVLAETISKSKVITGFILTAAETEVKPALKAGIAFAGENPLAYLLPFRGAVTNLPEIEKSSSGNGSFNFIAETDGIIRRVPLILRLGDSIYPSLVAEIARVAQGASSIIVKSSASSGESNFGEHTGIVNIKIGKAVIPTDEQGRVWLYDTGKIAQRTVPAWKILSGEFDPASMKDTIAVIGSSAGGIKDLRATPLNPVAAGTEIHVQLTEQILTGNYLQRPDWAVGAEMFFLVLLGLALIILLPRLGALGSAAICLLAIAGAFGFSWYSFIQSKLLFDPVFPSAASLVIYLVVSLMNYWRTENEKNQVRTAFGRYLSPSVVEQLANHPERLKLGGETKNMTVLFSDIRSFTTISERMNAEELTRFMNQYLTPMTDVILKHGGTIDKYIGDSIMAFWNAPLEDSEHAKHACQAAIAMQEELKALNNRLHQESQTHHRVFVPIHMGIGINTGNCSVGNMGSAQRFDYSVLGDSVNLASRLESLSKIYGIDLLIGENTFDAAKSENALEIDLIRVKGKNQPARIFTLFELSSPESQSCFNGLKSKHADMLKAYRSCDWGLAEKLARECMDKRFDLIPLRNLYQTYLTRIEEFRKAPPASDWQGVWDAKTK